MPKHIAVAAIEDWCVLYWGRFTMDQIFYTTVDVFGITPMEMEGPCREMYYNDARSCFVWYMKQLKPTTVTEIGKRLNRHHSGIIHLKGRADDLLSYGDEKFTDYIIRLHFKLQLFL